MPKGLFPWNEQTRIPSARTVKCPVRHLPKAASALERACMDIGLYFSRQVLSWEPIKYIKVGSVSCSWCLLYALALHVSKAMLT